MSTLRCLIADDEPLVRQGLRELLAAEPSIELVGEARDGLEALSMVTAEEPDVLFLDVQMPGLDGLQVVRELGPACPPAVVFVTAFDRYALEAFDLHAVDYLLKPFDDERFRRALGRARARVEAQGVRGPDAALVQLATTLRPAAPWPERFLVRVGPRMRFVETVSIDWIEGADNYARLHAAGERHLLRETLKSLEARLDPARFVRIHRSAIVQLARVAEVQALPSGDHAVVLSTGQRLTLSRSYRAAFEARVGGKL